MHKGLALTKFELRNSRAMVSKSFHEEASKNQQPEKRKGGKIKD